MKTCSFCCIIFPVIELELEEQPSLFPAAFCRLYPYKLFFCFLILFAKSLSDRTSNISVERASQYLNHYILKHAKRDTFSLPVTKDKLVLCKFNKTKIAQGF